MATERYTDPGLTRLRAPARDAKEMADVLADPRLGGFNVTCALEEPEHVIRRRINDFLAERVRDDLVLVYLSCHGVLDKRGRLFFAATDTVVSRLGSTAVGSAWLLDQLEECAARRQVLILDCCFSGAFRHSKGNTDLDVERRLLGSGRGRVVLTASRAGEYAFEGQPLPEVMHNGSVFTTVLVQGLRSGEADLDQDGWVSVDDALSMPQPGSRPTEGRIRSASSMPVRVPLCWLAILTCAPKRRGPRAEDSGLDESSLLQMLLTDTLTPAAIGRLYSNRIIVLSGEVESGVANKVCAQLLRLAAEDEADDITIYINSQGGSIYDGMAIYDTIKSCEPMWPPGRSAWPRASRSCYSRPGRRANAMPCPT